MKPHLDILDSCFDGIFCQHAAVQLDRWEAEVLGNVPVLDGQDLIHAFSFDPLGGHAAAGNG